MVTSHQGQFRQFDWKLAKKQVRHPQMPPQWEHSSFVRHWALNTLTQKIHIKTNFNVNWPK